MRKTESNATTMFRSKGLTRKNMTFAGDVFIDGDLNSAGLLFIGGNLTVSGSCHLNELICLGDITVEGNLSCGDIRMRGILSCKGNLAAYDLFVTNDLQELRYWDGATRREQVLLAFGEARSESYEQSDIFTSGNSVVVGGWFDVDDFDIQGGVSIGGDAINVDGQIRGMLDCGGTLSGEGLWVAGYAYVAQSIHVTGKLIAANLTCRGSCVAGSIQVDEDLDVAQAIVSDGDIEVGGHLRSDNRIQARGLVRAGKSVQSASSIFALKGVRAGRSYGIYAGLDVPEEHKAAHGFIACRTTPDGIKAGVHVKGKRFRQLKERQLVSWPASDRSDGV